MVADFRSAGMYMQAWFDAAGKWYMTEEDISYAELPRAVRTAYEAGDYAAWHVDDVDKLLRNGQETVYVLEVERAEQEFDLIIPRTACCCAKCPTGTAMTITAICFRRNCRRRSATSSPGNTPVPVSLMRAGEGKYRGRYHLRRESARRVLRYG